MKKFERNKSSDTAHEIKSKNDSNKNRRKKAWGTCKEEHPACLPAHSYEYCDRSPDTKDPKRRDERKARRKERQNKKN